MKTNKKYIFFIILMCMLVALAIFAGCDTKIRSLYFTENTYTVYLDESNIVTPNIVIKPKNHSYNLSVLNTTIARINPSDNRQIIAEKPGYTIIVVSSGEKKASVPLIVFEKKDSSIVPTQNDGKFSVYFLSEEGGFPAQKVNAGEYAKEPEGYTRPGYVLHGWYKDPAFKTLFDFKTMPIVENTTLYALWALDTPEFEYMHIDDECYITGFKYTYVPYTSVSFPEKDNEGLPVTGIKEKAFENHGSLSQITIPSSYKEIKEKAFEKCLKLESVTINGGIESIGKYAFNGCKKLKTVDIKGDTLNTISQNAFAQCSDLTNLTLPNSVTNIGKEAFKGCGKLKSFNMPEAIETISEQAFWGTAVQSINLHNAKTIGNDAFNHCLSLTNVTGGGELTNVGSYIFGSLNREYFPYATPFLKKYGNSDMPYILYLGTASKPNHALIYACPKTTKQELKIESTTETIAASAFGDVSNHTILFSRATPPHNIGEYAFGMTKTANSYYCPNELIVPKGAYQTFINSFIKFTEVPTEENPEVSVNLPTAYSYSLVQQIYEKRDTEIFGLEVSVREELTPDGETQTISYNTNNKLHILIQGLNNYLLSGIDISSREPVINVKQAIEKITQKADGHRKYVVDKIKSFAFYDNNNVVTSIILPCYIKEIEEYAFSHMSNCTETIFDLSDYNDSWWDKSSNETIITSTTFKLGELANSFKIRVPSNLLDKYKSKWNYEPLIPKIEAIP